MTSTLSLPLFHTNSLTSKLLSRSKTPSLCLSHKHSLFNKHISLSKTLSLSISQSKILYISLTNKNSFNKHISLSKTLSPSISHCPTLYLSLYLKLSLSHTFSLSRHLCCNRALYWFKGPTGHSRLFQPKTNFSECCNSSEASERTFSILLLLWPPSWSWCRGRWPWVAGRSTSWTSRP